MQNRSHAPRALLVVVAAVVLALGLGGAGVAGAWLAARILLRKFEEQDEAADDYFGFGR